MNDGVVELAELLELGDESPDGSVRVVDGAVVDGGLIVERAIPGDDRVGGRNDGVGFIEPEVDEEGSAGVAFLVEPIQGRGGERIPPDGFLPGLRALCDREGWLLIVDEVYTGFGRTGRWFACEHERVVPDLLCVGKGLTSGFPLSACLGRADVMDAWPPAGGEAIHTQTFLGHPAGCAAGLASLAVLEDEKLVERSAELGDAALERMRGRLARREGIIDVRGRGLLLGIECDGLERAARACSRALERGVIVLQSGDDGSVVSITPPLSISRDALELGIDVVADALA